MVARCKATTTAGVTCSAQPVRESGFCFWHDPGREAERRANRRKGGEARSNRARLRKQYAAEVLTLREVQGFLSKLLKDVTEGRTEPGVASAGASVARAIAAVSQAVDLEERLVDLERAAGLAEPRRYA